eukprot:5282535-Pyramimonas_sp.AAC.1
MAAEWLVSMLVCRADLPRWSAVLACRAGLPCWSAVLVCRAGLRKLHQTDIEQISALNFLKDAPSEMANVK